MKVDGKQQALEEKPKALLGQDPSQHSRQNISYASSCHAGVASPIDVNLSIGQSHDGPKPFQHDVNALCHGKIVREVDAVAIDGGGIHAEKPRHLAWMWSDHDGAF